MIRATAVCVDYMRIICRFSVTYYSLFVFSSGAVVSEGTPTLYLHVDTARLGVRSSLMSHDEPIDVQLR